MNSFPESTTASVQRMKCTVRGAVQGVGFRPFIYRLAKRYNLNGWVSNSSQGVLIEVEGRKGTLDQFLLRIEKEKPSHSFIQGMEASFLDSLGYKNFEIRESVSAGEKEAMVLADIATCAECLDEIFDVTNRRYLYPFTNCTHCGPRFSIIESLPYDRNNTTMAKFDMCDDCRREYENPLDRRFHAQPNACPRCGPHLELCAPKINGENVIASRYEALLKALGCIRSGEIVAVKGLGGFHLIVDARNEEAVARLRHRKHREAKPLAVMFPSLDAIQEECEVSELEERLLKSSESPIVLLKKKLTIENWSPACRSASHAGRLNIDYSPESTVNGQLSVAGAVAPNNPYLGAMLPYTPLHHILMHKLGFPVVATSGNLSDEPICTDEYEALERLKDIADVFLIHNRPIVRHVDDSVVRVVLGREQVLRRARGYAPLPITLKERMPELLAVGAHQKNTVALTKGENVFISQHIGDLETKEAFDAFSNVTTDLQKLFDAKPEAIIADLHPDYLSTQYAKQSALPVTQIQHHHAHVASCMAENELEGRVLGVSWDGTGYGPDGTIWGGEFLLTDDSSFHRVATFRQFCLPGSAKSVKEPRRTALGLLYEILGDALFKMNDLAPVAAFSESELSLLQQVISKRLNSPMTSSVGRLFDAVASIVNLRQCVSFEGQAAMELEFTIGKECSDKVYRFEIVEWSLPIVRRDSLGEKQNEQSSILNRQSTIIIDWSPMIVEVIHDVNQRETIPTISIKFHNTLVEMMVDVAKLIGEERVVLTGGCFQNRYLTERSVLRLQQEGFRPYWHQRVPPNDGGIALGQIYAATRVMNRERQELDSHTEKGSEYVLSDSR